MRRGLDFARLDREIGELRDRLAGLRRCSVCSPDSARTALDTAMLELDFSMDELQTCRDELEHLLTEDGRADAGGRRLDAMFQALPVPVLLLDRDGAVRMANAAALTVLGMSSANLTGTPLVHKVALGQRAQLQRHLAALVQGQEIEDASMKVELFRTGGRVDARLAMRRVDVAAVEPLVAVVVLPASLPLERTGCGPEERLTVLGRVSRLLLECTADGESPLLNRTARLLTQYLGDWALVDRLRGDHLDRVVVAGPGDDAGAAATRLLEGLAPGDAPLPAKAIKEGVQQLDAFAEESEGLGHTLEGCPALSVLGAGSVISAPMRDEIGVLGAVTLVRRAGGGGFTSADAHLLGEIGEHLARALRACAEDGALNHDRLPTVSGVEFAVAQQPSTVRSPSGGDFYTVFPSGDSWGLILGEVNGRGGATAEMTAMMRHGVGLLGFGDTRPARLLGRINQAVLVRGDEERLISAVAGHLTCGGGAVRLRLATAGHPPATVVRADGGLDHTEGGGTPLGLSAHCAPFAEERLLEPGDCALLYSDGILRARNQRGESYGEGRLREVLSRSAGQSARVLVKEVHDDVIAFCAGWLSDEVTLLAVGVPFAR